jgi:hypothetical protein
MQIYRSLSLSGKGMDVLNMVMNRWCVSKTVSFLNGWSNVSLSRSCLNNHKQLNFLEIAAYKNISLAFLR